MPNKHDISILGFSLFLLGKHFPLLCWVSDRWFQAVCWALRTQRSTVEGHPQERVDITGWPDGAWGCAGHVWIQASLDREEEF